MLFSGELKMKIKEKIMGTMVESFIIGDVEDRLLVFKDVFELKT